MELIINPYCHQQNVKINRRVHLSFVLLCKAFVLSSHIYYYRAEGFHFFTGSLFIQKTGQPSEILHAELCESTKG